MAGAFFFDQERVQFGVQVAQLVAVAALSADFGRLLRRLRADHVKCWLLLHVAAAGLRNVVVDWSLATHRGTFDLALPPLLGHGHVHGLLQAAEVLGRKCCFKRKLVRTISP